MSDLPFMAAVAFSGIVAIFVLTAGVRAAYRNGVTDGYGYAREPSCPGYWEAGNYLRKYMAHRWPELRNGQAKKSDPKLTAEPRQVMR